MSSIVEIPPIQFEPVAPLPPIRPFPNIIPFTDRDGDTYTSVLYEFMKYLNNVIRLVNEADEAKMKLIREELQKTRDDVQKALDSLAESSNESLVAMKQYVDEAVDSILNASIEVNDLIVVKLLTDLESGTRNMLDTLYQKLDTVSDPAVASTILNTLSETRKVLESIFVTRDNFNERLIESLNDAAVVEGFDKRYGFWRNVKAYGAKGDGKTDDTAAIQACLNDGPGTVFLPQGVYMISRELKLPSGVVIRGAGMRATVVKCMDTMSRHLNTITNAENNREYRTKYNYDVHIADLGINGNYSKRPVSAVDWEGNASGVMFSTVDRGLIERVLVEDAPLHCFAVDASRLPKKEDERPSFTPPGPSRNVTIRDCVAINPAIDDGFTTHYSSDILIDRCLAIRTIPSGVGGGINNGFEVDDGSYRVTVRDCVATGWETGVQIKGHNTATPAYDILIDNVLALNCGVGATVSGDGAYLDPLATGVSRNITINNFTFQSPRVHGEQALMGAAIKVYSYDNVTITNLKIIDAPRGAVVIARVSNLYIENVQTINSWNNLEDPEHGLIRFTGEFMGNARVRSVMCRGKVAGAIIRNNATATVHIDVDGIYAEALPNMTKGVISDTFMTPHRTYSGIRCTGFTQNIEIRAGSGAGSDVENYGPVMRGAGEPEGVIIGWPGWIYQSARGSLWVKKSGVSGTGWKQLAEV